MGFNPIEEARLFLQGLSGVPAFPFTPEEQSAFLRLSTEAQVRVVASGKAGDLWRLIRLGDPTRFLPLLEAFSHGMGLRRDPAALQAGAIIFAPAAAQAAGQLATVPFQQLFIATFLETIQTRMSAGTQTGPTDTYEEFAKSWQSYLRAGGAMRSRDGIPVKIGMGFQDMLVLEYLPIHVHWAVYEAMGGGRRDQASALLALARQAKPSEPAARWRKEAEAMAARLDPDSVRVAARAVHHLYVSEDDFVAPPGVRRLTTRLTIEANYMAGGVVHAAARFMDDALLEDFAKFVRLHSRMGDSAGCLGPYLLHSIAMSGHPRCVVVLQHLGLEITHKNLKKLALKLVERMAKKQGITAGQLQDRSAEDYGLNAAGQRSWDLDGYRVVVSLKEQGGPSLAIFDRERRKELDAVPAALASSAGFAEVRNVQKHLEEDLQLHRRRLEEAMIDRRSWPRDDWVASMALHPVLSPLTRRLLWKAGSRTGFFRIEQGRVVWLGVDDRPFEADPGSTYSIVHPVEMDLDDLRRWQSAAVRNRIPQPFKQLFRETYVVTPSEIKAGQSNRFAAQIVPPKQMYALLKSRGWSGFGGFGYDGDQEGWRDFAAYGVRAEMIRETSAGEEPGVVTLGGISFLRDDKASRSRVSLSLEDVPLIVFSEAMRDIDLVTSVAGKGTDKFWRDWSKQLAAGTLRWEDERKRYENLQVVSAGLRRRLLEELLPALKIEQQVRFEGSWAVVQGKLRRYRVHLASGGVHLEPEGRYISLANTSHEALRDLYGGDENDPLTRSILSRIHLLAHDDAITDSAIQRQLRR